MADLVWSRQYKTKLKVLLAPGNEAKMLRWGLRNKVWVARVECLGWVNQSRGFLGGNLYYGFEKKKKNGARRCRVEVETEALLVWYCQVSTVGGGQPVQRSFPQQVCVVSKGCVVWECFGLGSRGLKVCGVWSIWGCEIFGYVGAWWCCDVRKWFSISVNGVEVKWEQCFMVCLCRLFMVAVKWRPLNTKGSINSFRSFDDCSYAQTGYWSDVSPWNSHLTRDAWSSIFPHAKFHWHS